MTNQEMQALQPGELVRHKSGGESYTVTANYGLRVTAARTVDITNADEWERFDYVLMRWPSEKTGESHANSTGE